MTDKQSKKDLIAQYKARKITGGVYAIRNTAENRALVEATTDLQGSKNRFDFAQSTGSCVEMKLQKDWEKHGKDAFAFEILEQLDKGETQTDQEFADDIKLLKEIWLEKLAGERLY